MHWEISCLRHGFRHFSKGKSSVSKWWSLRIKTAFLLNKLKMKPFLWWFFFVSPYRLVLTACGLIMLNVMRLIVSQEKPGVVTDTWPRSLLGARCRASGGRWYLGASWVLLILLRNFPHHHQCCLLVTSLLTSALSSLPHAHTCTDFHTKIGLLSILNFPLLPFSLPVFLYREPHNWQ